MKEYDVSTAYKNKHCKTLKSVNNKLFLSIKIQNVALQFCMFANMYTHREAKFKRALRVHFLTHFTKNVCCFLTPKVKNGTDMFNPSIESSDFLFWHENICSRIFEKFVGNRQNTFFELKFSVFTHTLNFKI